MYYASISVYNLVPTNAQTEFKNYNKSHHIRKFLRILIIIMSL